MRVLPGSQRDYQLMSRWLLVKAVALMNDECDAHQLVVKLTLMNDYQCDYLDE